MGGGSRSRYRTGEIALAAGLSRQTLHPYALLGRIEPADRTPGGHRTFSAGVFRRLDEIRALCRDLTLARIRDQFAARGSGRASARRAR